MYPKQRILVFAALCLCSLPLKTWADPTSVPSAAPVAPSTAVGSLELSSTGNTPLQVRSGSAVRTVPDHGEIFAGDRLTTSAEQSGAVRLRDQSLIALAPSSDIEINQFTDSATTRSAEVTIGHGLIHVAVPKNIYSFKQPFVIRTRTAVMGVRGTEFLVEQTPENDAILHTLDGAVAIAKTPADLKLQKKIQMVTAGQMSSIGPNDSQPAPPKRFNRKTLFSHLEKRAGAINGEIVKQAKLRHEHAHAERLKHKQEGKEAKKKPKKNTEWKPKTHRKPVGKK